MKQFGTIFGFELKNYLKNKIFVGITCFLVAAIAVVMFFPRITHLMEDGNSPSEETPITARPIMLLCANPSHELSLQEEYLIRSFTAAFPDYDVRPFHGTQEALKQQINEQAAANAFYFDTLTSYTYFVNNLSLYDNNPAIANETLQSIYRMQALLASGLTEEQALQILSLQINGKTESLGKDQTSNFFYTYIMIFALYMVILLYGQMVATNVAAEKSSRAMELLITSAAPSSMMFGKVFASCAAGLIQLVTVFGSSLLFFHWNESYWGENLIIRSIFNMPMDLLLYMLSFFMLGFFIYAFLYGAIGSTASKLEDINTSVMPITLLFIAGFMIVMFSMVESNVDHLLMRICSYLPFTSPMAMFARIAMSTVPGYEIAISILILIASVFGVGILSAKIYRVGVLLYGTPPKIGAILKAIRKN